MTHKFQEPTLPKAATPLERAIYDFETKCDNHFKGANRIPINETELEKKKRLQDWKNARKHLNNQRLVIDNLCKLEDELDRYRKELGFVTTSEFVKKASKEKHHPTKVLIRNLYACGEPKPSTEHQAHHIIPGSGIWRKSDLRMVRNRLYMSGVRINDPRNGVWLAAGSRDKNKHWATPESPNHGATSGDNYEKWLIKRLNVTPGQSFIMSLQAIKTRLKSGKFPKKLEEPKDETWSGDE